MEYDEDVAELVRYMEKHNIEMGSSPIKAFMIAFERQRRLLETWEGIGRDVDDIYQAECNYDNDHLRYEEARNNVQCLLQKPKPNKGRIKQLLRDMEDEWKTLASDVQLRLTWSHQTVDDYKKLARIT